MHNHGDVQWPSHGSCTECIQNIWPSMVKPVSPMISFFRRLFLSKRPKAESGFKSQRGKLQVSSMFACDYILHADHCGMLSFSVSSLFVKIKIFPCYSLNHGALKRCLTYPTSCGNVYLLDICSFLIKYVCSLKVAGAGEVYSRFLQQIWTFIIHPTCFPPPPPHQFSTFFPSAPPVHP